MKILVPILTLAVAALLCACSTGSVIEKNVPGSPTPVSKIGYLHHLYSADGKTIVGDAFTAEGHDTYNWLLGKYGHLLKPPRPPDFGVTLSGEEYDLTPEAVHDWGVMATWARSAEHPQKTLLQKIGITN